MDSWPSQILREEELVWEGDAFHSECGELEEMMSHAEGL